MKFNYIPLIIGLICALGASTTNAAQNVFKAGVFPVSPITPPPIVPTQFDVIGHIQSASVDPTVCTGSGTQIDSRLWGGRVTVNGVEIIIPCYTILQLPATSMTWAELFDRSLIPSDTPIDASGLALDDKALAGPSQPGSLPLPAYEIHIVGNVVDNPVTGKSEHIAGLVFISQQSLNVGQGYIQSIDYKTGELCVSSGLPPAGLVGQTSESPQCLLPNARIRLNDAVGRFGLKHGGPGCSTSLIASERCDVEESQFDARFTVDAENPTVHAATGFPMCIPRMYPFDSSKGDTDSLCPQQNRPKQIASSKISCTNLPVANGKTFPAFPAQVDGYCHSFVMAPLSTTSPPPPGPCGSNGSFSIPCTTRADRQAPFEVGDYIDYSGTLLGDGNDPLVSPYYISAHTIKAHVGIYTYPGTKPVYVMIESLLAGTNALPILNIPQVVTARINVEGYTTDPSALVDIFGMDVDKVTGAVTDRLFATVNPSGPPSIGRVSFVPATGNYSPPTRNMRIVSRTLCNNGTAGSKTTPCVIPPAYLDPKNPMGKYANDIVAGQYNAPNFDFIFAENLFLGGPILPNNFQDLAFLACGSGPMTTPSAGSNPAIVEALDPAPWAKPMPAPSQCAGKFATQLTIPTTQTLDKVTVTKAIWDNKTNKGILTVTATSDIPNTTPNLQLYVQATTGSGAKMANDPQPMQLVTNPKVAPVGGMPCPATNNPCWQYKASGTIVDPLNPIINPALPTNIYGYPVDVTVYSSRGGKSSVTPTLICGTVTTSTGAVSTCQ